MMTEKFALVAFCCLWILLGMAVVPRLAADDAGLISWLIPWLWVAACPVAFWLGGRTAHQGLRLPLGVTGLALMLGLGGLLGAWTIHPNDLASLLALLLPWWLVPAALWPRDRQHGRPRFGLARFASWFVALGVVAALLWTGSRGGLVAGLAGVVAGLVLGARRRRLVVLALLLAATISAAIAPSTRGTDAYEDARGWIRDHDAEGVTWRHLSSGRGTIWRQAARIVEDFPLFGTGPGSYGVLIPAVYVPPIRSIDLHDPSAPRTPRVDDAHHLYLESAVAFGVPFLLAFLGLCGLGLSRRLSAARRSRDPAHAPTRILSAAAFGGLLAYLLHGLVDCAAPGTVVYVAGWAALGHACARPPGAGPSARFFRRARIATAGLVLLATILTTLAVARWLPAERLHHRAVDAVSDGDGTPSLFAEDDGSCRDAWWRERLAVSRGRSSTRHAVTVARCAPERIADVAALSPTDARRAEAVLTVRPRHAEALRWRLWTMPTTPAESLVRGYSQLFALRPHDADAKMEFLRRVDRSWREAHPRLTLALLAHACAHGDPGANACLGAGNLARRLDLGDEVADSYFLASEWPGARRLASPDRRSGRARRHPPDV